MNSPRTVPFRLRSVIAIALPACALVFFSLANIVIDGRQQHSDRIFRASIEARAKGQDAPPTTDGKARDRSLLPNLNRQLLADQRLDRALNILALPAALLAVLLSAWVFSGMRRASALLVDRNSRLAAGNEELEDALKSMREASAHKSRFLAHMSHELRTPLNSIIGFTEVICDKRAGPLTEIQEEFLGDSLRSARHLLALINDILDLEKIAAGHLVLNPEPLDLDLLIEETIHELSILAALEKKVRVSSELDERVRYVVLDRQKTKQILINLLTNAIKFTPDSGRVTVRTRAAGTGRCVLEVEDTGIGISEDGQTRLFHEFEQLELAQSKRLQGTGLGLVLTKKLVEAQGGTIAVSSQVGVGSTFCVMLPTVLELPAHAAMLAPEAEPDNCAEPPESRFPFAREKGHILIIDDDVNTQRLAKKALEDSGLLKDSGLEVTACLDGESGLAEIGRHCPAVVIVDLLMPRLDGFNLIERLRRIPETRTLPIVVWTNLDLTGREFDSLSRHVNKIVNKRGLDIARMSRELFT